MCPACISTLAWIAVGAGSGGGVTALLVKKLRGRNERNDPGRASQAGAPAHPDHEEIRDEERTPRGGLEE